MLTLLLPALHATAVRASPPPSPPGVPGRVRPCYEVPGLASLPFCDPSLAAPLRAADLVSRLTLSEKLAQLGSGMGSDNASNNSVPRCVQF